MSKYIAKADFQHILRVLNTNIDGTRKVDIALTAIKGVGRRFATVVCRKAEVDVTKRAGELKEKEIELLTSIISSPQDFDIPEWMFNRRKDIRDGKSKHLTSSQVFSAKRDDLERLKRIRSNRGLRHFWGYRVRGQHTKTTGRYGLHAHLAQLKK